MRLWSIIFIVIAFYACNREPEYKTIDGILEVPENRNDPDSRTLKLVYKVLKAKKTDSTKVPIVYLMGGPGGATLIMEDHWKNHPLRNDRDIVLMDQRGTGKSEANCVDLGDALFEVLKRNLDRDSESKVLDSLLTACKEAMKKGKVDLAGYNSRENAADFEDLRKVLGYKKWNLYGGSYGSRLGLTIMRDFPKGVRCAMLVSVFPPESDLFGDLEVNFENSLLAVLERCAENPNCNDRYPDLKKRLKKVLKKLEYEPIRINYIEEPFILNLQDVSTLLLMSLYSRFTIRNIPLLIEGLERGEAKPLTNEIERLERISNSFNWPMNYSVMAYEEFPFFDFSNIDKDKKISEFGMDTQKLDSSIEALLDWHSFRATDFENEPVTSEIPTLMVSGSLDPVTPPKYAIKALKHLKNGYRVLFQDESHVFNNPCFDQITKNFINNPTKKPNSECSDTRNPIEWNLTTLDPAKS